MKTTKEYNIDFEYYKMNIDIQIKWLAFLSSFKDIKGINYMEVIPKLENVKKKTYVCFANKAMLHNTKLVNIEIEKKLSSVLNSEDLSELSHYIGESLDSVQLNELVTSLFVRNQIQKHSARLFAISEYLEDNDDREIKFLRSAINRLLVEAPSTSMRFPGIRDTMTEFFAASLPINYDPSSTVTYYLYLVLMLLERVDAILCKTINASDNITNDINVLLDELKTLGRIQAGEILTGVFKTVEKHILEYTDPLNIKDSLQERSLQLDVKKEN